MGRFTSAAGRMQREVEVDDVLGRELDFDLMILMMMSSTLTSTLLDSRKRRNWRETQEKRRTDRLSIRAPTGSLFFYTRCGMHYFEGASSRLWMSSTIDSPDFTR